MHKHKDGKGYTPPMRKLRSTNALHDHGDGYTLAPNEPGHTHLNKDTKQRTEGPVDPGKGGKSGKGQKDAKKEEKEKSTKKVAKKKTTKKVSKKA